MAKLVNLIPNNKPKVTEALEDMEVALPSKVERFLDRLVSTIKSYNLPKKKEQAVIARVMDSMGITTAELNQAVQKLKKYKVVTRQKTGNSDHDWMGEGSTKLTDILRESEEIRQMPNELKKHFLEIISTYGQHREGMTRKSDIRQIAETLGAIADAAQEYTLREAGDWFDRVTIKRNMGELKKLQEKFEKEATEAKRQEERLEALYEDMGHVLGRYFEIADISEEQMMERLGLKGNQHKIDMNKNGKLDGEDFQMLRKK